MFKCFFLEGYYDCVVCENDGGGFAEVIIPGVLSLLGCVFAAPEGLPITLLLLQFVYIRIVETNAFYYLIFLKNFQLTWLNHHLEKIWPYVNEVYFFFFLFLLRYVYF